MDSTGKKIVVYGTSWCGGSRRAKQWLQSEKIDFDWVDIDENPEAAEYVKSVNNGFRSVPTILFPDGSLLVEPSSFELEAKFNRPN